jgi:DNA-binding NtrC family response regulator
VRELEGVLLRALVTLSPTRSGAAEIGAAAVEPFLDRPATAGTPTSSPLFPEELFAGRSYEDVQREVERAYLTSLFRKLGGDLRKMMQALGTKQANLYHRLRRAGIDVRKLRRKLRGF